MTDTLILHISDEVFLSVTLFFVVVRTMVVNLTSWIDSIGCGMHLPRRLIYKGDDPSTLHFTLLKRISESMTSGWNVIVKKESS